MHEPDKLRVPAAGASSGAAKTRERESERVGRSKNKGLVSSSRTLTRIRDNPRGWRGRRQLPTNTCEVLRAREASEDLFDKQVFGQKAEKQDQEGGRGEKKGHVFPQLLARSVCAPGASGDGLGIYAAAGKRSSLIFFLTRPPKCLRDRLSETSVPALKLHFPALAARPTAVHVHLLIFFLSAGTDFFYKSSLSPTFAAALEINSPSLADCFFLHVFPRDLLLRPYQSTFCSNKISR